MKKIRVILADDHNVMRESLRCFLDSIPNITVVGEAQDGKEALALIQKLSPDVLLLDMEMPGLTGLEVIQRLHAAGSPVHILVLSVYDDNEYKKGALMAGAANYLVKGDISPDATAEAIKNVVRGEQRAMRYRFIRKPAVNLRSRLKPIMQPV